MSQSKIKIIGESVNISIADLANAINAYAEELGKFHSFTKNTSPQETFFRILFEEHEKTAMELRVAYNYPEIFRSVHPHFRFSGPILYTDDLFRNIIDDVQVLTELGRRNWYDSLWINLRKFNSPPRSVYLAITHFDLKTLDIELNCSEVERTVIHMPQLEELNLRNGVMCKHKRKCVPDDLISCSKNLRKLSLENVVVHNYGVISNITNLYSLKLKNVELRLSDGEIQELVSNFSEIRSLHFEGMFDERGVQLYNEIFKNNLIEMTHIKSLNFTLEGNFQYEFGLNIRNREIKHITVHSSLIGTPNENLFAFFQALRNGFLAGSRITFYAILRKKYNSNAENPYLELLHGNIKYLQGDLLQLRKNIDYLRDSDRLEVKPLKAY